LESPVSLSKQYHSNLFKALAQILFIITQQIALVDQIQKAIRGIFKEVEGKRFIMGREIFISSILVDILKTFY